MGESASARTERELADLRRTIGRDLDALTERAREDMDPRNVVRRQPLAVLGSLGSVAVAAAVAVRRRAREARRMDKKVDVLLDGFGGRIDKLRGKARKTFRDQLRKELAEVETKGPRDIAVEATTGALTALAMSVARGLARRIVGDETSDGRRRLD